MNSHERVLAALRHEEPDRVPLDIGSTYVTGIMLKPYRELIDRLGIDEVVEICDINQQIALVSETVKQKLGVDFRNVDPKEGAAWKPEFVEEGGYRRFVDEWGIGWRMPLEGGFYYDMHSHPLAGTGEIHELENFSWPDTSDPHRIAGMAEEAARFTNDGWAVVTDSAAAGPLELTVWLSGFEKFYTDLALNPGYVTGLMDRIVDLHIRYWDNLLPLLGDTVLVIRSQDDMGGQGGLLFSADMYRRYIKPRHQRLFNFMKSRAKGEVFLFMHSCGAVRELIPDLIEVGVDILNPVQVNAAGMEAGELKREFGDSLTFWGGTVDPQKTLPFGTPSQVRDEVRRNMDVLAPGGGFVFAPIHNIQQGVPVENVLAMWEAWRDYGSY
ncbi:uroporphyrinogen decarboxylase family protein [candidate division KSB1 bacterium]